MKNVWVRRLIIAAFSLFVFGAVAGVAGVAGIFWYYGRDLHALDESLVQARQGGVEQGLIEAGERRLQELSKAVQKRSYIEPSDFLQ